MFCECVLDLKCPSLPRPINGHMSCVSSDVTADDRDAAVTCRLLCNDGYAPFNAPADVTSHVCGPLTNYSWSPSFSDDAERYLCLSESSAWLLLTVVYLHTAVHLAVSRGYHRHLD